MELQFLLDVSESMNIAASPADREKLIEITREGNGRPCAFACHKAEPKYGFGDLSVFEMKEIAEKKKGIKVSLRIDLLREAADAMIDKVLAKNNAPDSLLDITMQTNGFGTTFAKGFGPDKDAKKLKDSIRGFGSVANSHTSFTNALNNLALQLGTQGTGKSDKSTRKVVLLITDGVKDESFSSVGLGPIDPALCDTIKSKGFDLAILEIKYAEDSKEFFFNERVKPYYPRISSSLQACASPDLYNLATDSLGAQAALLKLVDKLVTQRLHIAR